MTKKLHVRVIKRNDGASNKGKLQRGNLVTEHDLILTKTKLHRWHISIHIQVTLAQRHFPFLSLLRFAPLYYYYYQILNNWSHYESKKVNSVTENKSEELWKVGSRVQSTTSNSLTVPSMQQSRMKSHKIVHYSSKRKLIQAYLYIKTKNKPLKMTNSTSIDFIFTGAWCDRMVAKHQSCKSTNK